MTFLTTAGVALFGLLTLLYILSRLRNHSGRAVDVRVYAGAALLATVLIWQAVRGISGYGEWFVPSAYPIVTVLQLVCAGVSILLLVTGVLAFVREGEEAEREKANGTHTGDLVARYFEITRHPYHISEYLERVCAIALDDATVASAIFLSGHKQDEFLLAATAGLGREERAHLEQYPAGRSILAETAEERRALIGGEFIYLDRNRQEKRSEFSSTLVLPLLVSGESVGVLLLLARSTGAFSASDASRYSSLAALAGQYIRSARLNRECQVASQSRNELEASFRDLVRRVEQVTGGDAVKPAVDSLANGLSGLLSSESALLCSLDNGQLCIVATDGGSRGGELGDQLRAALTDAIERGRPLILNQESAEAENRGRILSSSLVYPIPGEGKRRALVLRRFDSAIEFTDSSALQLDVIAPALARTLDMIAGEHLEKRRHEMFAVAARVLRVTLAGDTAPDGIDPVDTLMTLASPRCQIVLLSREGDTYVRQVVPRNTAASPVLITSLESDELPAHLSMGDGFAVFFRGEGDIRAWTHTLAEENRHAFQRMTTETGMPDLIAFLPVERKSGASLLLWIIRTTDGLDAGEWERFLSLVFELTQLRKKIDELRATIALPIVLPPPSGEPAEGSWINALNNHLSAVMGHAQLVGRRADISPAIANELGRILAETEAAATLVRGRQKHAADSPGRSVADGLAEQIGTLLGGMRISDNLYMVAGRPREISVQVAPQLSPPFDGARFRQFVQELLVRFAALADAEDIFTLTAYSDTGGMYLDITRHRRNFAPSDRVARFGRYLPVNEASRFRPADTFLRYLEDIPVGYAFDADAPVPSYLSFRFAVGNETDRAAQPGGVVLAIDDQPVILDLISAMCHSLGFETVTTTSGEEGIALIRKRRVDLVLTDLAMPGLSGLETARRIHLAEPKIPIVLVTGWEVRVSESELAGAGVVRVLYKPFRIEQLEEIFRSLGTGRLFV